MGEIFKGSSHELVKIRKIEGSTDFLKIFSLDFPIEISNIFLKISRTFNLSDLWGLPSWYLGLSVKKVSYKFM